MGQFVGCIEGMAEACRALDFPIVSGNVSLYNETRNEDGTGTAILPTPAIGGVGLIEDWRNAMTIGFKAEGDIICLIGASRRPAGASLGQSLWLREIRGREDGAPPEVDLEGERRTGSFVRGLIEDGVPSAVHDVADGGLLVAVAEMALAGGMGASLAAPTESLTAFLFGETQGLYVVTSPRDRPLSVLAMRAGVLAVPIGTTGGETISIANSEIALSDLRRAHEGFFPNLMSGELTVV
jgi:phosphoribosylformylglycinamidine synthase subunit PurL